jgi:hypothetical protein
MTTNFQGPFVLRVHYTANTTVGFNAHRVNFNVNVTSNVGVPGLPFSSYNVLSKASGEIALHTATENLLAILATFFNTAVDIGPIELWKVTVTDLGGGEYSVAEDFHAAYTPTINAGTSATATVVNSQMIVTLRTTEGGILRLDLLDTIFPSSAQQAFPSSNTPANAFVAYAISAPSVILGKDTSYPVVGKGLFPGLNEALFKKRNRQT